MLDEKQKYNVMYAGAIKEGFSEAAVKNIFVLKFKLSENKVDQYFSGKRMILKRSISKTKAETLKNKLLTIGAESFIAPCVDFADKKNAKDKNNNYQNLSKGNDSRIESASFKMSNKKESNINIQNNHDLVNNELLDEKIKNAKNLILEQQLKSQMIKPKSSPSYSKLIIFSIFLAGVIVFIYYSGKSII